MIIKSPLLRMLLLADTRLLRFWMAMCSFGFAIWVVFDPSYSDHHKMATLLAIAPVQATLFFTHGVALMYGVCTGRFSTALLLCEGLLGVFLWFGVGIAEAIEQGVPGPMFVAGLVAVYLLIRYPTHYEVTDGI